MREQPFSELKVLDLAWVVAGPLIGRTLADYGATVVRVESSKRIDTARVMGPFPGGKTDVQQSGLYENCNAGKLGLALDLSSNAGQDIVRKLVAWADVLVESFAPGQMKRWDLGYESLREIKPDLVMVSTSLMGQSGPHSSFAGFGNVGAAMAGYQYLVGEREAMPVGPFGPFTDFIGPRYGLLALLAALDHQRRSGEGCWLDVSQAEAGIQMLAPQIADYCLNGHVTTPDGNRDAQMAPHGVFQCAGGADDWIALAVRDDRDWEALGEVLGADLHRNPRYTTLEDRKRHEVEIEALIAAWASKRLAIAAQEELQSRGVPAHIAAGSADMLGDPQLVARGHFVALDHPLMGTSTVEASRFQLSGTPGGPTRSAPTYGRDRDLVLKGLLGMSSEEVGELERAGVLK